MRILLISFMLFLNLCIPVHSQSELFIEGARTETFLPSQSRVYNRPIYYFRYVDINARQTRRAINNELTVTQQANSSMRSARERLKNNRLIRKEKLDVDFDSPNCDKGYNSYVQHACYAYNDPEEVRDSVFLEQYELMVLLKRKKNFYKVCLNGEEYYVLRKQER